MMPITCGKSKINAVQTKCTQCNENSGNAILGYTTAPAPNVYPSIDSGIQMYQGAQPPPTAFPTTTYQQGVCVQPTLIITFVFELIESFFARIASPTGASMRSPSQ